MPPPWPSRLEQEIGPLGSFRSLAPHAWLVDAGGRALVAKVGPGALDEADGLRRLAAVTGAPPVPDVVFAEAALLVTAAVERRVRTPRHDEDLGRSLALLHGAPYPVWGGGSSWVGDCRVDPVVTDDGVDFYGTRLLELARRCHLAGAVDRVVARLPDLLPCGGPALLHGDLWWGNVVQGADGRSWLIDPSAHGGHPEEDLAMLALFGRIPDGLLGAYEETHPLQDGWRERVELFQLYPLLVHAVVFGHDYARRASEIATRFG